MKVDKFKVYLFFELKRYQEDLKFSDIVIIEDKTKNKKDETIKEKIDTNRIHETDHDEV